MSKSNHLLLTLYAMNDNMMDVVDATKNSLSCVVVATKNGALSASQTAKIKKAFTDGYASRATLTKLVWKYIKDYDLNEGKIVDIDENLRALLPASDKKKNSIDMLQVAKLVSSGINKEAVVKV